MLYFALLGVLSVPVQLNSQTSDRVFTGTRPLGMGETFVAVADDGNTIYWNPAGLPGLRRHEITTTYGNLFGLGIINSYLGYVFPIRDELSIGVDWAYLGFNDDELGYSRNKFNFSLGYQLFRSLSLGVNAKYLLNDMSLDGTSYGKGAGLGWDLGLLYSPWQNLRIGLAGYDLSGTAVIYDNNVSETVLRPGFRAGLAWRPLEGALLALDVDDRWHVGAEYWMAGILGLRAGLQGDLRTSTPEAAPLIPSYGLSLSYKTVRVDYGYERNPWLFPTHRFSIAFQFRPALVSIKSATLQEIPLFRSLHRYYENQEFAQVTLKNSAENDLPVNVSLFVPTMMETPHVEKKILPAKTTDDYTLGVTFAEDILTSSRATFDNLVQPEVKVTYTQENRDMFAVQKTDPTYVLGKGKISWDNPEWIASFVTPEDPVVDQFTRSNIHYYTPILKDLLSNSNLGKGMILFDALGSFGLTYNPDLQTPFLQISQDRSAFDTVKYPGELLKAKIGDCDDLTALYGSLLENLGIATMFLDVFAPGEGHIFLMFDSGLAPAEIPTGFMDPKEVVVLDGRVWIPIESTLVGESFFTAWQQGAYEYHKRKAEELIREIDIRSAQSTFQPGRIESLEIPFPEGEGVNDLLKNDLVQYSLWLRQIVLRQVGQLEGAQDFYDAGVIYLDFARLSEAREMFDGALKLDPYYSDALNTIGVIHTRKGEMKAALGMYARALELLPNHPGYKLNIAITHYLQGDKLRAQQEYNQVVTLDPGFAGELDLLFGLTGEEELPPAKERAEEAGELPEVTLTEDLEQELTARLDEREEARELFAGASEEAVLAVYLQRQARSNNFVGLTYARRGKYYLAEGYFTRAHQTDPEEADYLANLATVHYLLGRYELAFQEYERIKSTRPEMALQLKFIESRGVEPAQIKRFE